MPQHTVAPWRYNFGHLDHHVIRRSLPKGTSIISRDSRMSTFLHSFQHKNVDWTLLFVRYQCCSRFYVNIIAGPKDRTQVFRDAIYKDSMHLQSTAIFCKFSILYPCEQSPSTELLLLQSDGCRARLVTIEQFLCAESLAKFQL